MYSLLQAPSSEDTTKQAMAMGGALMMRAAAGQQAKMGVRPTERALPLAAVVTLDTFLHDFSVPKLIDKLADLEQHHLRAKIAATSRPQVQHGAGAAAAKPPSFAAMISELQLIDKLLVNFQRCVPFPSGQGVVKSNYPVNHESDHNLQTHGMYEISKPSFCKAERVELGIGPDVDGMLPVSWMHACALLMEGWCPCRAEKDMIELEKMVSNKVLLLRQRLKAKDDEFWVIFILASSQHA